MWLPANDGPMRVHEQRAGRASSAGGTLDAAIARLPRRRPRRGRPPTPSTRAAGRASTPTRRGGPRWRRGSGGTTRCAGPAPSRWRCAPAAAAGTWRTAASAGTTSPNDDRRRAVPADTSRAAPAHASAAPMTTTASTTSTSGSGRPRRAAPPARRAACFQKPEPAIERSCLGSHRPPTPWRSPCRTLPSVTARRRRRTAGAGSAASAGVAGRTPGRGPTTTPSSSPSSMIVRTSRAASPENHALTVSSSMRSRSSTAPCHGSMPCGGTNSVVASSAMSSSATRRTAGPAASPGGGSGPLRPYAASAAPPANTSLRPRRRPSGTCRRRRARRARASPSPTGRRRSGRGPAGPAAATSAGGPTDLITAPIVMPSPGSSGAITAR